MTRLIVTIAQVVIVFSLSTLLTASASETITLHSYCQKKAEVGTSFLNETKKGVTLDTVLADLEEAYARAERPRIHYAYFLEYKRMANDVFRHKDKSPEYFTRRFYEECMEQGY